MNQNNNSKRSKLAAAFLSGIAGLLFLGLGLVAGDVTASDTPGEDELCSSFTGQQCATHIKCYHKK